MGVTDDHLERVKAKAEGIDVDEWVGRDPDAPPDAPHPLLRYRFWRSQHPYERHPLDLLYERGIIAKRHIAASWLLIRLRSAALMRLDVARMGQVLKDLAREGLGNEATLTDGDYIYILDYRLDAPQRAIVERICWKYREHPLSEYWIEQNRQDIIKALDALFDAIKHLLPKSNLHD